MGISYETARQLAKIVANHSDRKSALMFGYQSMRIPVCDVVSLLASMGFDIDNMVELSGRIGDNATDSKLFFKMLGYPDVDALDIFDYEDADIIADLNAPIKCHDNRYDLIYNGGTLEHAANPVGVLTNAARMLRPGGIVVHQIPMNNFANHGYFMVSPILLFDFHMLNAFKELSLLIHIIKNDADQRGEQFITAKTPLDLPIFEQDKKYSIFFTAKKTIDCDPWALPVQSLDIVRSDILEHHWRLICGKRCIIWGAGGGYEKGCKPFVDNHRNDMELVGIIDSNPILHGKTKDGLNIFGPHELFGLNPEVVIIASTYRYEIQRSLQTAIRGEFRVI